MDWVKEWLGLVINFSCSHSLFLLGVHDVFEVGVPNTLLDCYLLLLLGQVLEDFVFSGLDVVEGEAILWLLSCLLLQLGFAYLRVFLLLLHDLVQRGLMIRDLLLFHLLSWSLRRGCLHS